MEKVVLIDLGTVKVGFSGKKLGNVNERFGSDAEANFAKFTAKFPGKLVYDMPAVGKDNIVEVDGITPERLWQMEADAIITRKPSSLLTLKAADCIPLVFYSPGENILALAHVGTSGAALHLPTKVIKELSIAAEKIYCYVGPSVGQKGYRFIDWDSSKKSLDASWDSYISHDADGVHIDLRKYVLDELKDLGVRAENIKVEDIDTGTDPNYFSHRRHKLTGEPDGRNCFAACLN